MLRYGMTLKDGEELYGKYVGSWGGDVPLWRFEARRDGRTVAAVTKGGDPRQLRLDVRSSAAVLREGDTYDMAAVRIRVLDGNGNTAPYAQLSVRLRLEGDAELAGPDAVTAEGGMCGTYVRTIGRPGSAVLTVSAPGTEDVKISFEITDH